jgi:hypothetical protein
MAVKTHIAPLPGDTQRFGDFVSSFLETARELHRELHAAVLATGRVDREMEQAQHELERALAGENMDRRAAHEALNSVKRGRQHLARMKDSQGAAVRVAQGVNSMIGILERKLGRFFKQGA